MIILLDRQHAGKPDKQDHGAVHGELVETDLTLAYGNHLVTYLRERGHTVICYGWPGFVGSYAQRQAMAVEVAKAHPLERCIYVALHVNAGGGTYALVEYDARSAGGAKVARALAASLDGLAEVTAGKVEAMDSGTRGFVCLAGIYAGPSNLCGVLVEPGFIDSDAHASLWTAEGLARVAGALGVGLTQ